ncbi:hypothetical protein CDL15_Pgr021096 [Punica granatum]|uniref:Uncharacterized protein n=1 Tax=Punica granatum TaxID=22663 RepID=A0A218XLJ0_PUNGR|nr:hypothetical protein CDL15_Pgr021096 [Punica granatum]
MHLNLLNALTPHIKRISEILTSLSRKGVLPSLGTRGKSRRSGKGSRETRLERTDPNRSSRVNWQTRLAVWLVGAVFVDRDLSRKGVLPSLGTRGKSRRSGKGSRETRLERTDPNRSSRVDWQTLQAVWLVGVVSVDRDGIFARGQLRWIPKRLRIAPVVVSGEEHP